MLSHLLDPNIEGTNSGFSAKNSCGVKFRVASSMFFLVHRSCAGIVSVQIF